MPNQFTENLFFDEERDPYMVGNPFSQAEAVGAIQQQQAQPFGDPFTPQQAVQQVAPQSFAPGMPAGMGGNPTLPPGTTGINPAASLPGQAPQQPQQPGQSRLGTFLNSPGMSMANQALNNIDAMRRGRSPTVSPTQAYQQTVQRQALLRLREKQAEEEKAYREAMIEQKKDANRIAIAKAGMPSAYQEKVNGYMTSLGLDPRDPASMQDSRISEFLSKSGINIDLGKTETNAWAENQLSRSVDSYNTIMDKAAEADDTIGRFDQLKRLNVNMPKGGGLGEAWVDVSRNLQGLGIDIPGFNKNTTPYELFKAIATENQFKRTQMLKGAISEKEIGLAGMMDAGLANSQQGRYFILEFRRAEAMKHQQIATAVDDWMANTGAEHFNEREFRKSDEFKSVSERPFATPELLHHAKRVNPDGMKDFKKIGGVWYTEDPETGEAVPVFQE